MPVRDVYSYVNPVHDPATSDGDFRILVNSYCTQVREGMIHLSGR